MAETKTKRAEKSNSAPTKIVRDNTFVRAVADKALVLDLGRDLEIACLQAGPALTTWSDTGEGIELGLNPALTEVVRLRMPLSNAFDLALHIIQIGISKNIIDHSKLAALLEGMNDESQSDQPSDGGGDAD